MSFNRLKFVREEIDRSPKIALDVFRGLPGASKYRPSQLVKGFKVEMEHADTVNGDPVTIAKIVLDHLREHPDYYDRLQKAGL